MLKIYSRVKLIGHKYEGDGGFDGAIGYVIEVYPDGKYEVEFSNSQGISTAQLVVDETDLVILPEAKY